MKKILLPIFLISLAAVGFAQTNAAGTWTGRIQFDRAELTKGMSGEQKKAVEKQLAEAAKLRIDLTLRPNNTFTLSFNPPADMKGMQKMTVEGKWLQKGSAVTLTATRQNGKPVPAKEQQPQTMTIVSGGKTMRWSQGKDPRQGTIVFTRTK